MLPEISGRMDLEELLKFLPEDRRAKITKLVKEGDVELAHYRLEGGLINASWHDAVKGEIVKYLARTGKAKRTGYENGVYDFYIDDRVGRAPRKAMKKLADELKLAINEDYKPCSLCERPTNKTVAQQHAGRLEGTPSGVEARKAWKLSERRMKNRGVTEESPCCWYCYQNKLATIPEAKQ